MQAGERELIMEKTVKEALFKMPLPMLAKLGYDETLVRSAVREGKYVLTITLQRSAVAHESIG